MIEQDNAETAEVTQKPQKNSKAFLAVLLRFLRSFCGFCVEEEARSSPPNAKTQRKSRPKRAA